MPIKVENEKMKNENKKQRNDVKQDEKSEIGNMTHA